MFHHLLPPSSTCYCDTPTFGKYQENRSLKTSYTWRTQFLWTPNTYDKNEQLDVSFVCCYFLPLMLPQYTHAKKVSGEQKFKDFFFITYTIFIDTIGHTPKFKIKHLGEAVRYLLPLMWIHRSLEDNQESRILKASSPRRTQSLLTPYNYFNNEKFCRGVGNAWCPVTSFHLCYTNTPRLWNYHEGKSLKTSSSRTQFYWLYLLPCMMPRYTKAWRMIRRAEV